MASEDKVMAPSKIRIPLQYQSVCVVNALVVPELAQYEATA